MCGLGEMTARGAEGKISASEKRIYEPLREDGEYMRV